MSKRKINLNADQVSAEILGDGSNRLDALTAGADWTNNRQIIQPKSTVGSGGRITADGTLHTGACTCNAIHVSSVLAGTIDISDAVGAAGTSLMTLTLLANTSQTFDLQGLAFGTGIFADFTTLTGGCTALVGPAVS
jgi:hypothetical protein